MKTSQVNKTLSQLLDYLEIPEEDSLISVFLKNDKLFLLLLSDTSNQYYTVSVSREEYNKIVKPKGY